MANSIQAEDRIPVIVGIGEITDRPKDIKDGLEPLVLLEEALKRAEQDSGTTWLGEIGSLDIVNFLSWRYQDPARQLSDRLGIKPKHAYYGPVGGESPIRYLHEAAQRIARGECSVAAVCGAEAQSTATKAERAGIDLAWTPFARDVEEPKRGAAFRLLDVMGERCPRQVDAGALGLGRGRLRLGAADRGDAAFAARDAFGRLMQIADRALAADRAVIEMRGIDAEALRQLFFRVAIAPAQEIDDIERLDFPEQFAAGVFFCALERLLQQRERLEAG